MKTKKKKAPRAGASGSLYSNSEMERLVPIETDPGASEPYRTPWRRDYARLIHSAAFRRLQGKTQLFPGRESDFFRNRLTHSLEVAQIAKSIALRFNYEHPYFLQNPINTDLVETAALAHDLGHPPFGHNGETALDECMRANGGFEGNAQTLRILSKLEKRETLGGGSELETAVVDGGDNRAGLNLTFRTLAAVLKYDNEIPVRRTASAGVVKGYYYTEKDLVAQIKSKVGENGSKPFKTIECSIMDIADDIAYSTYDLEDAFKAGFLSPVSMLAQDNPVAKRVVKEVSARLRKSYPHLSKSELEFRRDDVYLILTDVFKDIWTGCETTLEEYKKDEWPAPIVSSFVALTATQASNQMASSGYYRSRLTSNFVGFYIRSLQLEFNKKKPAHSRVFLDVETFKRLEVMKNFAYQALIMSPMLKVAEYRGKDIVKQIFRALSEDDGHMLMPSDFQQLYMDLQQPAEKQRVICDFIAGMTDRYAVQFYGRLFGTNPETIFSPL